MKKMLCSLLTVLLLVSCFAGTGNAAERAMGKFDVTVKAGELKPAKTGFPMAAGETVTINATYSPSSADVDFGLVDKNGRFHYLKGENGAFNEKIEIPQNGTYTFAIRNNSDVDIEVTGYLMGQSAYLYPVDRIGSRRIPKLLQLRKEGCSMESGNEAAPARFLRDWSCASSHTPARPA